MLPSGWGKTALGEVMSFKNGLNTDKSQYGSGLKFVNVMDVFNNDFLTEDKIIGRVQIDAKRLEDNLLMFGDILFNRTSETFDEIAMSTVYLDNAQAIFGGFVIRGRPYSGVFEPEFSVYAFQSSIFRTQVIKLGQGAVRANIGQKDLATVIIPIPPLPEQKKIAQILSTWDKAITTTEQLIANSQQQKKALMQQLLTGKKRLLDDNGVRFSVEWRTVLLGELGNTFTGLTGKSKEDFGKGVPYITYMNIYSNSAINPSQLEYVDIAKDENQNIVQKGDIFFTTSSETPEEVGMSSVLLHEPIVPTYLNSFCFGFRLNKNCLVIPYFMQFLLRSERVRLEISKLAQGATRYNLSKTNLMKVKLFLPNHLEEQQKIASVLSSADREIEVLQSKLTALKQEKKALMQQLLTGKRRVRVD